MGALFKKTQPKTSPHQERRKRRREWGLILLTLLLLVAATRFESQLTDLTEKLPLTNHLLILSLININLLLALLFFFLITRNLFKLIIERRQGVPGTKLRTRLVIAFISLSLIPTMLLFFASAGFITSSIENWFNKRIEISLEESLEVAQTYYKNQAANALYYGQQLARLVKENKLLNEKNLSQLKELINKKQQEYNLGVVEVFSSTHEELVRAANPQVPMSNFTDPDSKNIQEALRGNHFTRITPAGKADLIRGIVPVHSNWNEEDIVGVIVVNYYVPYSLVNKMEEISSSFHEYKETKLLKNQIKNSYIVLLLLIALIIIFLATWFGFHLAKSITGPVQELVTATHNVAQGNMNIHLKPKGNDEIATLINTFNKMTYDLDRFQKQLKEKNLQLQKSNLEIDRRRQYMEIVLRNVAAGVISLDPQGRLSTINKSAEEILNINGKNLIGRPYKQIIDSQQLPVIQEILRELKKSDKDQLQRQFTFHMGDKQISLLAKVNSLKDENGTFIGTVIVIDDMTHMLKAQRIAAWREVARRIAHEIKNPLTPIQLSAERLRRRYLNQFTDKDQVFDNCTRMIVKQVEDLKTLVNEFSNFARLPASSPDKTDLNTLVEEALVLYQEGHKEHQFDTDLDSTIPWLQLDGKQIKRALTNLLDNAVAATPSGGTISIATQFLPELNLVRLMLSDTGSGIPATDKPKLFEPYFSTKKGGTGLGLAIVSTIISDHNGYIRVKDNTPCGTQIIIDFPLGYLSQAYINHEDSP